MVSGFPLDVDVGVPDPDTLVILELEPALTSLIGALLGVTPAPLPLVD
jgi:hypothetical protein